MQRLITLKLIVSILLYMHFGTLALLAQTPADDKPARISVVVPNNTPIDVETASTVSSGIMVEGSLISFRVVKPVVINDQVVIETGAVATAKVIKLKRGGFWGKAGKIGWELIDVTGADGKSIPVQAANEVKGEAKEAEAKTKAVVSGALLGLMSFGLLAPLGLLYGFKKGKNVSIPSGTMFRIYTKGEATVEVLDKKKAAS